MARLSVVTPFGFATALGALLSAIGYLLYKPVFWHGFDAGIAPMVIFLFFLGAVQLASIGIIGEYIGAIYTQVRKRPYVIEKERSGV
jgi:hypothetical protein